MGFSGKHAVICISSVNGPLKQSYICKKNCRLICLKFIIGGVLFVWLFEINCMCQQLNELVQPAVK